jgi:glycosyltransferase involved in cell wall biosynthesis
MLSIITATYNDANLKESLISLKNQSLSENKYEIILVNDNPKNKLYVEKLIDRLSFSNLKLIHNEKNL